MLNEEAQTVTFEYKDQKTPVIEQTATFENARQKVEVSVVKQDAETKTVVAGAEFGIYAKEDILTHEEVIVKADTLLGKAVSDRDPLCACGPFDGCRSKRGLQCGEKESGRSADRRL